MASMLVGVVRAGERAFGGGRKKKAKAAAGPAPALRQSAGLTADAATGPADANAAEPARRSNRLPLAN
jgi:hypothetical protein